ncbi:EamA family transporter [Propionicicella superfundia]|uniref:EamA family transporter n=1 Tax=Propionicicella superfundia TaxID=348582 RepID=UPI000412CBA4|nr:DMT family transporter [Propionicicella superfundia]
MQSKSGVPGVSALPRTGVGILIGLVASLAFAASGPFVRSLFAVGWSPGAAVFWRIACAAVVLVPVALWMLRGRLSDLVREWRAVLAFGLAAVATPQLMYFAAVSRMSVSIALLIEYMAPVLLVLVAWARTRRLPRRAVLFGAIVSVVGLLCVLDLAGASPDALGVLFSFGAMFGAASYFVLSARPTRLHPVVLAAFGLAVGAAVLGLAICAGVLPYAAPLVDTALFGRIAPWWVPLSVIALVATALAYGLGIAGVSLMGERLASFVGLSEVLFATVLAALMLGEVPSLVQVVGAALIITGVVLVRFGTGAGTPSDTSGAAAGCATPARCRRRDPR